MRRLKTIAKQSWIGMAILTALVILLIRGWGVLQMLELSHYDLMFSMRSSIQSVARSPQIVIVGYTESDIRKLQEPILSDQILFTLLSRILNQDPALVGLDFFRESPIAYQSLKQLFQTESRLYLPARFLGSQQEQITAPDEVPLARVGDVSVPLDRNGILRRNFLSVCSQRQPSGDCATYHPSLALQLAEAYLAPKGIRPKATEKGQLQLGEAVFQQVLPNSGGYIDVASGGGYQVLVNWRDLEKSFTTVTVSEVLQGKIDPKLFQNRIVLLGSRTPSQGDLFTTPFSSFKGFDAIFGVESIGFFTEQIIWSALGEKPNLKTLPEAGESLLIFIWATIALTGLASFYSYLKTSLLKLFLLLSVILTILTFLISFIAFLVSWWIPFIPYSGVIFIALLGQCFILADRQRQRYLSHLERELAALQEQLEQTHQLQIAQEKSDSISFLGAKLAHDIRNVLGMLEGNLSNSLTTVREMSWLYEDDEQWEELQDSLTAMEKNLNRIQDFVNSVLSYASDYEENAVTYCYLPSFLETVLAHAWSERKATNVALFRDYDPLLNDQTIPVLPFSLERALLNLLDNSFDALLARTQWKAESPWIQVVTRDRGAFIEIQVIDNGVGIDPDYQDQVFDLLFTSKSGNGTGLGLYIVYESIVKLHRGEILLQEARPGKTSFLIQLPKQFRQEL